jgi:hypothetical protein
LAAKNRTRFGISCAGAPDGPQAWARLLCFELYLHAPRRAAVARTRRTPRRDSRTPNRGDAGRGTVSRPPGSRAGVTRLSPTSKVRNFFRRESHPARGARPRTCRNVEKHQRSYQQSYALTAFRGQAVGNEADSRLESVRVGPPPNALTHERRRGRQGVEGGCLAATARPKSSLPIYRRGNRRLVPREHSGVRYTSKVMSASMSLGVSATTSAWR